MIRHHLIATLTAVAAFLAAATAQAQTQPSQEQALVDGARSTIEALKTDPDFSSFNSLLRQAKAVIVVPRLIKAGLIVGGEGGSGVLLAKNVQGRWSAPAFYHIGGASLGLQIGAQTSEVVLIVMNSHALDKLLTDRVTLGGDVSVATGSSGAGVAAATTTSAGDDVYVFARNKGVFGGMTIQGGWLEPNEPANRAYYGPGANAHDIIIDQKYSNPGADQLRGSLPS